MDIDVETTKVPSVLMTARLGEEPHEERKIAIDPVFLNFSPIKWLKLLNIKLLAAMLPYFQLKSVNVCLQDLVENVQMENSMIKSTVCAKN